ncbi:MAG: transposase [Delftia acidovorans]|nr:transposase [Delftia acidovorans]
MQWFAAGSGKRGHNPKFSDAVIQFCLTSKNIFGLALPQSMGIMGFIFIYQDCHGSRQVSTRFAAANSACKSVWSWS